MPNLPPRRGRPPGSKNQKTTKNPSDDGYRALPADDSAREDAIKPYRFTAKTLVTMEAKLRSVFLDGEPIDAQELDAGVEAWAVYLYAVDFNALHPLYPLLIWNAAFLGPDLIKNAEKIAAMMGLKKKSVESVVRGTADLREVKGMRVT